MGVTCFSPPLSPPFVGVAEELSASCMLVHASAACIHTALYAAAVCTYLRVYTVQGNPVLSTAGKTFLK